MNGYHIFSQLKDAGCLMAFNIALFVAWFFAGFAWVLKRISRRVKTFFAA